MLASESCIVPAPLLTSRPAPVTPARTFRSTPAEPLLTVNVRLPAERQMLPACASEPVERMTDVPAPPVWANVASPPMTILPEFEAWEAS